MTEQINTQLTDEQALAELERRVAAMEPGPFRHSWEEIVAIEQNRQRIRRIEEATRVKLPPDTNRWRLSGLPPPAEPPPAEPSAQRPTGWAKFDAIGPPPGVSIIDAMVEADTRRQREDAIAAERMRRQAIIDMYHEAKVVDEQQRREQAEARGFHKSPQDDDFDLR